MKKNNPSALLVARTSVRLLAAANLGFLRRDMLTVYGRDTIYGADLSALLAGDLSPSSVVARSILQRTVRSGDSSRRSARRCLADKSARRTKR